MRLNTLFGVITCSFFIHTSSYASSDLRNWQDLAATFKKAAQICDGKCTDVCGSVATDLEKWRGVSQHQQQLKKTIMSCNGAFFMNKTARNHADKGSVGMLIMRSITELQNIANAENQDGSANVAAAQGNTTALPQVDTAIHTSNGELDIQKVQRLYTQTAQFCGPIIGGAPNDMMFRLCRDQCTQEAQKLDDSIKGHQQALIKDKTASGLDIINVKSEIASHVQSVGYYLSDQATCIRTLQKGDFNKGDTPEIISALLQAGNEIKDGKWPLKEKPSLSLDGLTKTKPIQLPMFTMQLRAKDATQKFDWDSAVAQIKQYPEYQTMEQQVNKNGFSVNELKNAMRELNKVKNTADKRQWQQKAQQFSEFGSMAELLEATNQPCDKNYLSQFKDDSLWLNPAKKMSLTPDPKGNNINYLIDPVHLQRLCYEKLHPSLVAEYDKAKSANALAAISAKYISQAPLDGGATCRDCPPSRAMHSKQWLPQGQAYLDQRNQQFAAQQLKQEQSQQRHNAQIAKQQAQQDQAKTQKDQIKSVLAFFEADYPTAIEQSALYTKPLKRMTEDAWRNSKTVTKREAQYLATLITAKAKFSRQLLQKADAQHMLTTFRQQADEVETQNHQYSSNNANQNRKAVANPLLVTPLPNSKLKLSSLVSCVGAAPLLDTFVKDPFELSGEQFIYLEQMLVECTNVAQTGVTPIKGKSGGDIQTDLYQSLVAPYVKKQNHGYGPSGTVSFIISIAQGIDHRLRNAGIATDQTPQQQRFIVHAVDQHGIKHIQQLVEQSFTQITGTTPDAIRQLAKQEHGNKAGQVAQLKQQAKGQPLPRAPYKFNLQEVYVINDHIQRNQWRCPMHDLEKIKNIDINIKQYIASLHSCGFTSQNSQFRTFTTDYKKAHRAHIRGR